MRQRAFGTLSLLAALLITSSWALADDVRTSKAAYGDWQTDAPCVMRKITANDLNPPRMRRDANSTPWSITKASGTAGPRPTMPVLRRTHVCHRDLRGRQATPSADQALSLRGPTLTTTTSSSASGTGGAGRSAAVQEMRIPANADSDSDRMRTAIPIECGQRSGDRGQWLPSTALRAHSAVSVSSFPRLVAFSGGLRRVSPSSARRCAVWTRRSRTASAIVGSPNTAESYNS
jgi:hypothetical protein